MAYIGSQPGVSSQRLETAYYATSGQTTFIAPAGYVPGNIDVFLNGSKLLNGDDFTASNGIAIVLTEAAALNDEVVLLAYIPRGLSDGYTKPEADAKYLTIANPNYTGTLTGGTGVINIGSGQVYKDASGNVGIGTSSPTTRLHVAGAVTVESNSQWFTMGTNTPTNSYGSFLKGGTTNIVGYIGTDGSGIVSGGTGDNFGIRAENSLLFMAGGNNERMRLSSAGNLALGLTPSTTWGTGKAFELASKGNGIWSAAGFTALLQNVYFDGSNYRYGTSGAAARLDLESGSYKFYTAPSGTAGNAISFTQAMTMLSNGNLGIGVEPDTRLHVGGTLKISSVSQWFTMGATTTAASYGAFVKGGGTATVGYIGTDGSGIIGGGVGNNFGIRAENELFLMSGAAECMRFSTAGLAGIGTAPVSDSRFTTRNDIAGVFAATFTNFSASGYGISIGTDSSYLAYFYGNGARTTIVGSITTNGTNTSYNTSSDYRLKDITGELTGSGAFIDALKPKIGTWKADGSPFVGFLAHEFQEVSPSSVTGEKDAVDKDGKPKYQGMQASSSEVMANIIAELQSLRKRVGELEAA